jgi:hypothetical protein
MTLLYDGPTASDLARRVRGEFLEMPGLQLNLPQAQRLWGLDAPLCKAVLDALVEGGVLSRSDRGYSLRRNQP